MEKINKLFNLIKSSTAKDTYIIFAGNTLSAILGFVYTLVVARSLSVPDFGIFSAAVNLIALLNSVTDFGISSAAVNFVSEKEANNDLEASNKYIKASSLLRLEITLILSIVVIFFAKYISKTLLITENNNIAILVALVSFTLALPMLLPFILQAKKKFLYSIIADNSLYISRLVITFAFMYLTSLTIENSLISFMLGALIGTVVGSFLLRFDFLKSKPVVEVYKNLVGFSGWIAVNRIISSISGRLDILMLAVMASATTTGLYSIPTKLAGFGTVLASSFSSVLATRLAGFNDKRVEKKYIVKATIALIPLIAGIIFITLVANPLIVFLFGNKYIESGPYLKALLISMIPFILTVPSVTAIIYSLKKPVYIGIFSFLQIALIFVINLFLIPRYGAFGPIITIGITNIVLAIYTWTIVAWYYWYQKE